MHYIIGLGNPTDAYRDTRHNVGWQFLDSLRISDNFSAPQTNKSTHLTTATGQLADIPLTLVYPESYMNRSGEAVRKLFSSDVPLPPILVIHDDIALPLGQWRISFGRNSGGHNGVKSLIASLGTNQFARLRIGIYPSPIDELRPQINLNLADFVLQSFTKNEQERLSTLKKLLPELLTVWLQHGHQAAMDKFN